MAPKKKKHSNDMRTLAIKHYQNGDSQHDIALKTLLPRSTMEYIIKKYKTTKCIGNLLGRDRKRKTTDRPIQRKLKLNRRRLASIVKTEIENELRTSLHPDTIRKRAHESGLFDRIARKKPYVNKVSRLKRLRLAKKMFKKPIEYWKMII